MKLIKILGHPVLVMSMYLLILISGEHFGGFYLIYILMGLPFGAPHALLALTGIITMFLGYKIHSKRFLKVKPILYFLGNLFLTSALFLFFSASKGYNNSTFEQTIPLISFGFFSICLLSNLILILSLFLKWKNKDQEPLRAAT